MNWSLKPCSGQGQFCLPSFQARIYWKFLFPQGSAFVLLARCLVSASLGQFLFHPSWPISVPSPPQSRASSLSPFLFRNFASRCFTVCLVSVWPPLTDLERLEGRVPVWGDLQAPSLLHRLVRSVYCCWLRSGRAGVKEHRPRPPEAPPAERANKRGEAVPEAPISVLAHSSDCHRSPHGAETFCGLLVV